MAGYCQYRGCKGVVYGSGHLCSAGHLQAQEERELTPNSTDDKKRNPVETVLAHPAICSIIEALGPAKVTVALLNSCWLCGDSLKKGKEYCSKLCENNAMLWRRAIEKNE